jgi:hypothetical protein
MTKIIAYCNCLVKALITPHPSDQIALEAMARARGSGKAATAARRPRNAFALSGGTP